MSLKLVPYNNLLNISPGIRWLDIAVVSADRDPIFDDEFGRPSYLGVSGAYYISWDIERNSTTYDISSFYAGASACNEYTLLTKEHPRTSIHGLPTVSSTYLSGLGNVVVGYKTQFYPPCCLIYPTPQNISTPIDDLPNIMSWSMSASGGGVENLRFVLVPGEYNITSYLWDPADSNILVDSVTYNTEYKEISCNITNQSNSPWYFDITAVQWDDAEFGVRSLPESHVIKWYYDSFSGFSCAIQIDKSSDSVFFAYPNECPSGTITTPNSAVTHVRFMFDTPGIKTISAAVVEYEPIISYSTFTSIITDAGSNALTVFTCNVSDFIGSFVESEWDAYKWTISNSTHSTSGVNLSCMVDNAGNKYFASGTWDTSGSYIWESPSGIYSDFRTVSFYCSNYGNINREIWPNYGIYENIENKVAKSNATSIYFYSSSFAILRSGDALHSSISAIQLYGDSTNPQYAVLPPTEQVLFWRNQSNALFASNLSVSSIKVSATDIYTLCDGGETPPICRSLYPLSGDTLSGSTVDQGIYSISVHYTNNPTLSAVLTWTNVNYDNISLDNTNINNCSYTKSFYVSALTNLLGQDFLILGQDASANQTLLRWKTNDSSHVKFYDSNGVLVSNNTIYVSDNINPVYVVISPEESLNCQLCSFLIGVDYLKSNDTTTVLSSISTSEFYYDEWPLNFEHNIRFNYENRNSINNTEGIYRFLDGSRTSYTANLSCLITGIGSKELIPSTSTNNSIIWSFNGSQYPLNRSIITPTFNLNDFSTKTHITCTIGVSVENLSAFPGFLSGHCLDPIYLTVTFVNSSIVTEPNGIYYPEKVWDNKVLSALDIDPSLYWSLNPFPTSYGDGNTMIYHFSSIGDIYDSYNWMIGNTVTEATCSSDIEYNVNSVENVYAQYNVSVAGFNSYLLNYLTSSYPNDNNGSNTRYLNWKNFDNSIKMNLYDVPTGINIVASFEGYDTNNQKTTLAATIKMPSYSVVSIRDYSYKWQVSADNGTIYNSSLLSPVLIIPNTVRNGVIYITANHESWIEPQNGYAFVESSKVTVFGPYNLDFLNVDFTVDSNTPYTTYNTDTDVTAIPPASLSGTIVILGDTLSESDYDYYWIVGENTYTDTSWLCAFSAPGTEPYDPTTVTPTSINISLYLTLTSGGTFTKSKELIVRAPSNPIFNIVPESYYAITGIPIKMYNESVPFIPFEELYWDINNGSIYSNTSSICAAFTTEGLQTVWLTGIDFKRYEHEGFDKPVYVYESWPVYNANALVSLRKISPKLPYDFNSIKIPPNEWVTNLTFNKAIQRLKLNWDYLNDVSTLYATPPVLYTGYWGSSSIGWALKDLDSNYQTVTASITGLKDYVIGEDYSYIATNTTIMICDNQLSGLPIKTINGPSIGIDFIDIKSIAIDDKQRMIVFDKGYQMVFLIRYDPTNAYSDIKTLNYWGGLGGPNAKYKFSNAVDMILSDNYEIYVLDAGNNRIKKYTQSGSWLKTYELPSLNTDENWYSLSVDNVDNIYVISNTKIIKIDTDEEVTTIEWTNLIDSDYITTPIQIHASKDLNILYVLLETAILKFTSIGGFIGVFGETEYTYGGQKLYKRVLHCNNHNLFMVDNNYIVKYDDYIEYQYVKSELNNSLLWTSTDYEINKDEDVQYWVYNKCFHRFYDLLTSFRNALFGRIYITTDDNGKVIYRIYQRNEKYINDLQYTKDDIFIGVNEYVTPEVVNRCLKQLYDIENVILQEFVGQDTMWKWEDTTRSGDNPTTWNSTVSTVLWTEAVM